MDEHKVTEEITQTGAHITVKIYCSCGIVVEDDTSKTPLRVLRASILKLHEEQEKIEADLEKPRSVKKLAKQQKKIEKIYREDKLADDSVTDLDENDIPDNQVEDKGGVNND